MLKVSSDLLPTSIVKLIEECHASHRYDPDFRAGWGRDLEHGFDLGLLGVGLST
jgi:hypothetical protein